MRSEASTPRSVDGRCAGRTDITPVRSSGSRSARLPFAWLRTFRSSLLIRPCSHHLHDHHIDTTAVLLSCCYPSYYTSSVSMPPYSPLLHSHHVFPGFAFIFVTTSTCTYILPLPPRPITRSRYCTAHTSLAPTLLTYIAPDNVSHARPELHHALMFIIMRVGPPPVCTCVCVYVCAIVLVLLCIIVSIPLLVLVLIPTSCACSSAPLLSLLASLLPLLEPSPPLYSTSTPRISFKQKYITSLAPPRPRILSGMARFRYRHTSSVAVRPHSTSSPAFHTYAGAAVDVRSPPQTNPDRTSASLCVPCLCPDSRRVARLREHKGHKAEGCHAVTFIAEVHI
ncbi:hypothetical protein C8T65DRAFT_60611 [Cerioporus squamosus]|nr:hypothetical protein C8T65DRAFT_60611 [Cerioporus squamosus]